MPIDVTCGCGQKMSAPDSLAGKKARCPGCGMVIDVPAPSGLGFQDDQPQGQYGQQPVQQGYQQPAYQPPAYQPPGYATPGYGAPRRRRGPRRQGHRHAPQETSMMAVLGFVFAFLCTPLGLIFSIIGYNECSSGKKTGTGFAVAGLVLNIIFILLSIIWIAMVMSMASQGPPPPSPYGP